MRSIFSDGAHSRVGPNWPFKIEEPVTPHNDDYDIAREERNIPYEPSEDVIAEFNHAVADGDTTLQGVFERVKEAADDDVSDADLHSWVYLEMLKRKQTVPSSMVGPAGMTVCVSLGDDAPATSPPAETTQQRSVPLDRWPLPAKPSLTQQKESCGRWCYHARSIVLQYCRRARGSSCRARGLRLSRGPRRHLLAEPARLLPVQLLKMHALRRL